MASLNLPWQVRKARTSAKYRASSNSDRGHTGHSAGDIVGIRITKSNELENHVFYYKGTFCNISPANKLSFRRVGLREEKGDIIKITNTSHTYKMVFQIYVPHPRDYWVERTSGVLFPRQTAGIWIAVEPGARESAINEDVFTVTALQCGGAVVIPEQVNKQMQELAQDSPQNRSPQYMEHRIHCEVQMDEEDQDDYMNFYQEMEQRKPVTCLGEAVESLKENALARDLEELDEAKDCDDAAELSELAEYEFYEEAIKTGAEPQDLINQNITTENCKVTEEDSEADEITECVHHDENTAEDLLSSADNNLA